MKSHSYLANYGRQRSRQDSRLLTLVSMRENPDDLDPREGTPRSFLSRHIPCRVDVIRRE